MCCPTICHVYLTRHLFARLRIINLELIISYSSHYDWCVSVFACVRGRWIMCTCVYIVRTRKRKRILLLSSHLTRIYLHPLHHHRSEIKRILITKNIQFRHHTLCLIYYSPSTCLLIDRFFKLLQYGPVSVSLYYNNI